MDNKTDPQLKILNQLTEKEIGEQKKKFLLALDNLICDFDSIKDVMSFQRLEDHPTWWFSMRSIRMKTTDFYLSYKIEIDKLKMDKD